MATPTLELTYRLEWDTKDVPRAAAVMEQVLLARLRSAVIRNAEVELVDDTRVRVRLLNPSKPDARVAKEVLGLGGFTLRAAAPADVQESYLRTEQIPEGYRAWDNPHPTAGDYAAYGSSVLLQDPPLLTAEAVTKARSWNDTTGEHGGGGVILIDFDETGVRVLDSMAKELSGLRPVGLLGATWGQSLKWLSVVPSDRHLGRLLLTLPTEPEARRLAGHLSAGYLPARIGSVFFGPFQEGRPESEAWTGPPLDLERPGREIAQRYATLSYAYARLAEFSEHGVLEKGLLGIEHAMREYGRTREVDRTLVETLRWLGKLFRDPELGLPPRADAVAIAKDRSALAVINDDQVRVLTPQSSAWSEAIPLSSPCRGMEFVTPDHLVVRTAADEREGALEGAAVKVRAVEQQGAIVIRVAEVLEPGPILGKSANGRFIVYKTGRKGGVGILDMDSVPEGTHTAPLQPLTLKEPYTHPSWSSISPDGQRVLVGTYDPEYLGRESHLQTRLFQLLDTRADQVLGSFRGSYENYYTFSWSPDGRWIACHENDQPIPDWDVPVGSSLRDHVRLYDGLTAEEKWSHEARNPGDFGWTEDGLVRCAGKLWDAPTGEVVTP